MADQKDQDQIEETTSLVSESGYGLSEEVSEMLFSALELEDKEKIIEICENIHSADIADFLETINREKRATFIEAIQNDFDPKILVELGPEVTEEMVEKIGPTRTAHSLNALDTDESLYVVETLKDTEQEVILKELRTDISNALKEGLAYPEESAGRIMDKRLVCVPEYWSVGQTTEYLRNHEELPDDFFEIFVVDAKYKPVGGVLLSRVIRSSNDTIISDIMGRDIHTIPTHMDRAEVAYIFQQYDLSAAPVINDHDRLVGIINIDDIVDVVQQEAEEDIFLLGGVQDTDFHANSLSTTSRRFPWLFINLITAILASIVIGFFDATIEQVVALAILMPITASMGGNAGTQTLTVSVRALATKELTTLNALRIVGKETVVGGFNGTIFAILSGIVVYAWFGDALLAGLFATAMIVTMIIAGLSGALIPLFLSRVGADPAIASVVFLTTITDVVAFASFLGLATLVLF